MFNRLQNIFDLLVFHWLHSWLIINVYTIFLQSHLALLLVVVDASCLMDLRIL